MTKLRRLAALAALAGLGLLAGVLSAQFQPAATGPGAYVSAGAGVSAFQVDYGQRVLGGYSVFADIHPHWRYGFEAEARFLRYHTDEQVTETSYLIGPHVYLRKYGRARPYVKFLVGDGEINFPFGYATGNYLALAPGAGLDFSLTDRIAIRAVDFEYQDWPQFSYGTLNPYGVSAGINIRLNNLNRIPKHAGR